MIREEIILYYSAVLVEYFPCLKSIIKSVIPNQITIQYWIEMANPSEILNLPVAPFNQNKLGNVCQYLSYLTQLLVKEYTSQPNEVGPHQFM